MTCWQIFVCHDTGTGKTIYVFFGSSALLGIVQGGVDFLRSIDQVVAEISKLLD